VSIWVKNGRLFLVLHITQNGEYSPSIHEWNGAIYTFRKMRWEGKETYGWVFQQCYDTAFKDVDVSMFGIREGFPVVLWDGRLFMEDTVISNETCFFGN
jgi:hypothetical protein